MTPLHRYYRHTVEKPTDPKTSILPRNGGCISEGPGPIPRKKYKVVKFNRSTFQKARTFYNRWTELGARAGRSTSVVWRESPSPSAMTLRNPGSPSRDDSHIVIF